MELNGELHAQATLTSEESFRYPLGRRLGWAHSELDNTSR